MKLRWTERFKKDYQSLPQNVQKQTLRKLKLLLQNFYHPSLRVKKMKGYIFWEARVNRGYRIIFEISSDVYILYRVGPHDIFKNP